MLLRFVDHSSEHFFCAIRRTCFAAGNREECRYHLRQGGCEGCSQRVGLPRFSPLRGLTDTSIPAVSMKRKPNSSLRRYKGLEGTLSPSGGTSVLMTSQKRSSTLRSRSTGSSTTSLTTVCNRNSQVLAHSLRMLTVFVAGFTYDKMLHTLPDDAWDIIQKIHVRAPFRLIRAAAPYMRIKVHATPPSSIRCGAHIKLG